SILNVPNVHKICTSSRPSIIVSSRFLSCFPSTIIIFILSLHPFHCTFLKQKAIHDVFCLPILEQLFHYSADINASYSSAESNSSNCSSFVGSMTMNHPWSYGDSFTVSGLSCSVPLISTTRPLTGAYSSDTVFTDSTLPNGSFISISVPI